MAATLDLEWNHDLILSQAGGLVLAYDWDAMRQRIFRRILTNPVFRDTDGTIVPPGYFYHPLYGLGLKYVVGQVMTRDNKEKLKQRVTQGILEDAETDPSFLPEVSISEPGFKRMDVYASFRTKLGVQESLFFEVSEI